MYGKTFNNDLVDKIGQKHQNAKCQLILNLITINIMRASKGHFISCLWILEN